MPLRTVDLVTVRDCKAGMVEMRRRLISEELKVAEERFGMMGMNRGRKCSGIECGQTTVSFWDPALENSLLRWSKEGKVLDRRSKMFQRGLDCLAVCHQASWVIVERIQG